LSETYAPLTAKLWQRPARAGQSPSNRKSTSVS
jgi:hypothetical protein